MSVNLCRSGSFCLLLASLLARLPACLLTCLLACLLALAVSGGWLLLLSVAECFLLPSVLEALLSQRASHSKLLRWMYVRM